MGKEDATELREVVEVKDDAPAEVTAKLLPKTKLPLPQKPQAQKNNLCDKCGDEVKRVDRSELRMYECYMFVFCMLSLFLPVSVFHQQIHKPL